MSQNAMVRFAIAQKENATHAFWLQIRWDSRVKLLNTSWSQAFSIASRNVTFLSKEFFSICLDWTGNCLLGKIVLGCENTSRN